MLSIRIEIKYYLILILLLAVSVGLLVGMLFSDSEAEYRYLEMLGNEGYEYVYTASGSIGSDDYLYATGRVSFATGEDLSGGIYADVLMILDGTEYTELSFFDGECSLGERECAVSENTAALHSLGLGDIIYSRHRVTGNVVGYSIKEILPPAYGIMDADTSGGRGVIILGYDEEFASLVKCEYIGFTVDYPSDASKAAGVALLDVLSKREIEGELLISLLVSQSLLAILASIISLFGMIAHSRYQRVYYTRIALLGMPATELKRMAILDYLIPVVISNIVSALIASLILSLRHGFLAYRTPLVCLGAVLISSLICSIILSRKTERC